MKQKQIKNKQFLTDDKFDTLARMRHFHLRHMGLCGRFFLWPPILFQLQLIGMNMRIYCEIAQH